MFLVKINFVPCLESRRAIVEPYQRNEVGMPQIINCGKLDVWDP